VSTTEKRIHRALYYILAIAMRVTMAWFVWNHVVLAILLRQPGRVTWLEAVWLMFFVGLFGEITKWPGDKA